MKKLVTVWFAAVLQCACSDPVASQNNAAPVQPTTPAQTIVYDCQSNAGEFSFTTRTRSGEIALWLPPRFERSYLVLAQVRAASGARYEADGVVVWSKGNEAYLEVDGESIRGCAENRYASIWEHAKLSGIDFRGVGNEPGWVLEIRNADSIRFEYDYGQSEVSAPAPEPQTDVSNRTSVWAAQGDAGEFIVTVEGISCNDTMSDHTFGSRVTVLLGDREFHGCGRALH
jgi:membrane-bound inhibitor of C-type lysozyme